MKITYAKPYLDNSDARAVYETVKNGWISMGPKALQFEREFARYTGAKYAVSADNGTSALHIALAALGVGPNDEVILPSMTFISTGNVVLYQNAVPVLAECDPLTFNVTADEIKRRITRKTKVIMPVDMGGLPVDYDSIQKVADEYKLKFVADSAESLGALYKGRKVGSIAETHAFSFFPNKNVTTGEGGMITTSNKKLFERFKAIRNQGQDYRYHHKYLGYNYRLCDILASLGIVQLRRLEWILKEKVKLVNNYNRAFKNAKNITTPFVPDYVTRHAWFLYTIIIENIPRDKVVEKLKAKGIETRICFPPVHIQPVYKERFGYKALDLPVTYETYKKVLSLPMWIGLTEKQQKYIADTVLEICE